MKIEVNRFLDAVEAENLPEADEASVAGVLVQVTQQVETVGADPLHT